MYEELSARWEMPLTNNLAENSVCLFSIGRKNWEFSNSQEGIRVSSTVYCRFRQMSTICTVK